MSLKIYVAGPITGLTQKQVKENFLSIVNSLRKMGFKVFHPLMGKEQNFRGNYKMKPTYGPDADVLLSDHAITSRDHWMIEQSDIVFMNLQHAQKISIGCVSELDRANCLRKHTVLILDKGNVHSHGFVFDNADVVFETVEQGIEYMKCFTSIWEKTEEE
jgi:nucleoside 2-deoxyribosyltransferase